MSLQYGGVSSVKDVPTCVTLPGYPGFGQGREAAQCEREQSRRVKSRDLTLRGT